MKQEEKKQLNPFSVMEEEVLGFWEKSRTFQKSVEKEAPKGDYVFYDGPPFITGLPHYATLLPSIAKDVIPRYWTMKGYRVERVWGWDCHGLPAENKVEKELGLQNKKDIEKLGVGKFVEACRNYVNTGSEQWKWYIDRIGRWVDMDNAYKTMDLDFMESTIWAFKKLYDDGFIYEGYRTSLHCPRCATPLSKFEITMDAGSYKDVDDETVVVKFKLKNQENTYVLAWTTTPWTLPGNLALAVGKGIDYVKFYHKVNLSKATSVDEKIIKENKTGKGSYIMSKDIFWRWIQSGSDAVKMEDLISFDLSLSEADNDICNNISFEDFSKKYKIEVIKSSDLIGLEYEPVFDLGNEKITGHDKTHRIYAADFVTTDEGTGVVHIAPNFGEDDFNLGKEIGLPMIDLMDENGIYTEEAGSWAGEYFKKANTRALEELGDKLFVKSRHTHSYPFCYRCNTRLIHKTQKAWYLKIEDIRQKMLDNNKKDINWVPEHFKEGRFQDNIERAPDWCLSRSRYWGSPIPVWKCENCNELKVVGSIKEIEELSGDKVDDLHRPNIDNPEFSCSCGGKMKRVPEVLDCWFESGSMPFAQFHYPFNEKKKNEWSNIFPADFIIEYTGQLRGWFYYLHVLSNAMLDSVAFKNVIVTGVLAGTDGRKMSKSFGNYPDPKETLDKYGSDALRVYFMSSPIMTGGDMAFSEKDVQDALRKNVIILWNVVKFYDLFRNEYKGELNISDEPKSENVLDRWILARLYQLITEVTNAVEAYNLPAATRPIGNFIDDLSTWYIRRSRDRFKGDDVVDAKSALETTGYVLMQLSKVIAPFTPFIAEQVWQKVSGNEFKDENKSVHLESWPIARNLELGTHNDILEKMEMVMKIVEMGLAKRDEAGIKVRQPLNQLKVKSQKSKVEDAYLSLIKDEVNIKEVVFVDGGDDLVVELDTEITPELKQECSKRELVRFINNLRKDANLSLGDRAIIYLATESEEIKMVVEKFKADILKDTLSDDLVLKMEDGLEFVRDVNVNGEAVKMGIRKK